MDLNLDLSGRRVLVAGGARPARRTIARCLAAGAAVFLVSDTFDVLPTGVDRVLLPTTRSGWSDLVGAVDLVIAVDPVEAIDSAVSRAARQRRVWLTREQPASVSATGRVTLVGGGPGDDGLLTVAAMSALRGADVVLYDLLGPRDRLEEWAPGATHVNVGKTPGHHAVPQREIERMLVEHALAGRTVVRLKGGDPFVFGRGGEEVIACRDAGVSVSVVPGVTSAISVPGTAGIPVTHRELSRLFTVVSGHAPLSDDELGHLAGLGGTVVVLMGVATLPHLAAGLMRRGLSPDTPVALIERGFSASQRTTIATLAGIVRVAQQTGARSPAVIVIGEVVRLAGSSDAEAARLLHDTVSLASSA
ncbi:uroporphyrin-III C-methyltransferase [Marisediminicola sp. UYEF4]|uniref:uroporphyrinogen-III C-methyltransferase n=1 Tax=Marisediminicola sp. UYEF4 TaxID=1756384 RepID=UPI0033985A02